MNISDFDYPLVDERIARFPLEERDASRLLVWRGGGAAEGSSGDRVVTETTFNKIGEFLPAGSLLVFNNTRVVRARLVMSKSTGARVEILCLEPHDPADYERAFAARGGCEWRVMIGNAKKWKSGPVESGELKAYRVAENIVRFEWDGGQTFGELLERLGRMPIPPYLGRDTEDVDLTRYQTVYSRHEGSVAAPTAGLHFTPELISRLAGRSGAGFGIETDEVTLHVGAGTFLPVKTTDALDHRMHVEHFEVRLSTLEHLAARLRSGGRVIAVGTTSVRTLESLPALAWRLEVSRRSRNSSLTPAKDGSSVSEISACRLGGRQTDELHRSSGGAMEVAGQFETDDLPAGFSGPEALEILIKYLKDNNLDRFTASTRIMITPGFRFRIVGGLITNFHQPRSTLLLLVSAFTGGRWREIYDYALSHDFRFLSYGDSSLLLPR